MSRNFGIPLRPHQPRREQLIGPAGRDLISTICWIAFMGGIFAILFIEFPDGLAGLRDSHPAIIAGGHRLSLTLTGGEDRP